MGRTYAKHFIPLESNPEVFTSLIHKLGTSPALSVEDVFTLDEPEFLPHPALALILIFPGGEDYEQQRQKDLADPGIITSNTEDIVWFKQTIHNACGLYAILHGVCNGEARNFIDTLLAKLMNGSLPLTPDQRHAVLEQSHELEEIYASVAKKGETSVPDAQEEVDHHFVCFVKGYDGHIYELDGDKKGPIDTEVVLQSDQDVLSEGGVKVIREKILQKGEENAGFGLMALVKT